VRVFFFGVGYCAEALIRRLHPIEASGTARSSARVAALRASGVEAFAFDGIRADPGVDEAVRRAEAIVVSIPPQGDEGPLDLFATAIAGGAGLRRILYYSTIGVYGDHRGAWVDETSATLTRSARGLNRLAEEARWMAAGNTRGVAVDILRLPGIYGPGRNALDKLRRGEARRVIKPGYVSNRAHVDDIAEVSRLVLTRGLEGQAWNVADDEPAPPQDVIAYAAALLGLDPAPEETFDSAVLSPITASLFAEDRRVSNRKAKALLGFKPLFPTYREGLKALAEAGEGRDG
jgi:nucleoside-diphosphate-sugar epimerase